MAAGRLASPGTENGPCADENCGHKDCSITREMAAQVCLFCSKPIGYERGFYNIYENGDVHLAHADCLEASILAE